MKEINKLQLSTLIPSQLIGYSISLIIGIFIILTTFQVYKDVSPLFTGEEKLFNKDIAVISKRITIFKTLDKSKAYFKDKEITNINEQPFIKDVATFTPATYKINAYTNSNGNIPPFYTDLFFESIPDSYIDIAPEQWRWTSDNNFIPIIIPKDYLNLYNFGFAESQGLPLLSENTISEIEFNIRLSGNGSTGEFKSKIVGFSSRINTILVPLNFMKWANNRYGKQNRSMNISRILVEFTNPSDEKITPFFEENSYNINNEKLEYNKIIFLFKSAIYFFTGLAILIIILSVSAIVLGLFLILQRNQEIIKNLYNIGYHYKKIARLYQIVLTAVTLFVTISAIISSSVVRGIYTDKLKYLIANTEQSNTIILFGIIITITLIAIYNILIVKRIKRIVTH
ncbi:MAG: hypothetical protein N4A72_14125 [Bacteroidales bacterium]|jgi:hypothetical protein|nr:hypothetical protein [Bacteroidales bacterium]